MTYCFLSKAFGERLERMATGLIPKLIEEINFHARYTPYAHAGFMSSYFHIFSSESTLYVEEIENVSIDKLNEILNKAYEILSITCNRKTDKTCYHYEKPNFRNIFHRYDYVKIIP